MIIRASLAMALALTLASSQDKKSPCDLVRVEEGKYCAKCSKVLTKTEKTSDFDKDGNCKNCAGAPEKARVCVKEWIPVCGMHEQRPHERGCCASKFCCKLTPVVSLVVYRCPSCKAETRDEAKRACKDGCKGGALETVCTKSGTAPHGAACDMAKVESGPYCTDKGCRKLLDKTDMDKEGRCISCKKKPETVKICVKADDGKAFRARIAITCKACKAEGAEGASCSTKDCPRAGKPLEAVCTDSGGWPHGGDAPKKDK